MPVQLQVRTQIQANWSGQVFGEKLAAQLSAGQINAQQKLDSLRTYIENKGDGAQIRVVNTTRDAELAFQFKSFGYKPYRQERTAMALKALLAQAGTSPEMASTVVDGVLKDGNNYRTATKAMVSQILNDPEVKKAIAPEPKPAQAPGHSPAAKAPAGEIHAEAMAPNAMPHEPSSVVAQARAFTVNGASTTKTLDRFLQAQGFHIGNSLGKGGFGSVKSLGNAPGNSPQVVKYFEKNGQLKPVNLSAVRDTKSMNEAYAAYLVKSSDPQWVQPKVVAPTHYLVGCSKSIPGGVTDLQLVPIRELKKTIQENKKNGVGELRCYGLIMDKAPGKEVGQQLDTLSKNPNQRAILTQSGLETLRSLNARGFVHRDIKPANLIFNGKELNFIDTGMLFKVRKTDADKAETQEQINSTEVDQKRIDQLPQRKLGTRFYMHQDLLFKSKGYIGGQADLHAFALVMLEMEAPKVLEAMKRVLSNGDSNAQIGPLDLVSFMQTLDEVIESAGSSNSLKRAATDLKKNLQDPNHLANLGFECLLMASTDLDKNSAADWANRKYSDNVYATLLKHPSLALNQSVPV